MRAPDTRLNLAADPLSPTGAITTTIPLLVVSEERKQQELRRTGDRLEPGTRRRTLVLTMLCIAWLLTGYGLIGLSFHLTDGDRARTGRP